MASPGASSDEGEICEVGSVKATTSLPQYDGPVVDRADRPRSRYSISPGPQVDGPYSKKSFERSRSPYSARLYGGGKRLRDDDHYDRSSRDPRRFKVHYEEDRPPASRRSNYGFYRDLDRPGPDTGLRYDDPPRYSEPRHRTRSRSPYRRPGNDNGRGIRDENKRDGNRHGSHAGSHIGRSNGYDNSHGRKSSDLSVSNGAQGPERTDSSKLEAKHDQGYINTRDENKGGGPRSSNVSNQQAIENSAPEPEPLDENAIIEERRRKREAVKAAVKAKYQRAATPTVVQALSLDEKHVEPSIGDTPNDYRQSTRSASPLVSTVQTPKESQGPTTPGAMVVTDDQDLANKFGGSEMVIEEDGPSAADYDPTMDMREDQRRDDERHGEDMAAGIYNENIRPMGEQEVLLPPTTEPNAPFLKEENDDFDMFADDDDDMFAAHPEAIDEKTVEKPVAEMSKAIPLPPPKTLGVGMLDNWDDVEGYYKVILGELLDGRYHVQANLGRGMFAAVVRATELSTKNLVAIKIIRANDTMKKAGLKEIEILEKLNEADPADKKHIVRLQRHFEHKGHLCMVFENLSLNLREVLKKFGRDVGININAIRHYAYQMFLGLSLMKRCSILHADLKPDNILISENRNLLKICDLGSASDASENEITPYLVSRFYRAPEIILGMPYDGAIDVWSIGCTLYELYTGKILFTGRSNNQMLRSIMECRGKFTTKMLKKSQFAGLHFDELMNFRSVEQDKLTGKDIVKMLPISKATRDIRTRLLSVSKGLSDVETKELNLFIDLIDRCLTLNPEKRCTPSEALKHPFILRASAAATSAK